MYKFSRSKGNHGNIWTSAIISYMLPGDQLGVWQGTNAHMPYPKSIPEEEIPTAYVNQITNDTSQMSSFMYDTNVRTRRKKVCAELHFKYGRTCKKHRNKAGMKERKKTTLLQKDGGKERQENYPTSAVYAADVG